MNLKIIYCAICLALTSCNFNKNTINKEILYMKMRFENEKLQKNILKGNLISMIKFNNTKFKLDSVMNSKGDTISFNDYVSKGKTLVLYSGVSYCSTCLEKELEAFNTFAKESNLHFQTILLAKSAGLRHLIIDKKKKEYVFDIGIIINNHGIEIVETTDNPFYFVVDEDMTMSDIFFLSKSFEYLSKIYFQLISKKY